MNKVFTRRTFGAATVTLPVPLALAACGAGGPAAGTGEAGPATVRSGVKLLLLGNQAQASADAVQELVTAFPKAVAGLSAEYINVPTNYYDKLQSLLAGDTAPDVCWTDVRQFPAYAAAGRLRQIDQLAARDKFDVADFFEKGVVQYRWNSGAGGSAERLYGLPWDFGFRQIFYNVNLFQEAGVPLPPGDWKAGGWTFNDFLDAARRLTKKDGGQITQFGYANTIDYSAWVYANGGRNTNEENTESWLDKPEATEAFGFLADLMQRHQVAQTTAHMKERNPINTFMEGKAAMSLHPTASGTAQFRRIKDFTWDVAPLPRGAQLKGDRRTHGGGSGWMIPAAGKNPEEAWALLKYLSARDAHEQFARAGVAPSRMSVARSAVWMDPSVPPKSKGVFAEGGNYIMSNPKLLSWDEYDAAVAKELDKLWAAEVNAATLSTNLKRVTAPLIQKHKDQLAELKKSAR